MPTIGRKLLGTVAALTCIGAGIYLLLQHTDVSNSVFNVLMHGIGVYFIGKGIFIGVTVHSQVDTQRTNETMLEFAAAAWQRWTGEDTRNPDARDADGLDEEAAAVRRGAQAERGS